MFSCLPTLLHSRLNGGIGAKEFSLPSIKMGRLAFIQILTISMSVLFTLKIFDNNKKQGRERAAGNICFDFHLGDWSGERLGRTEHL